ncbi:MAG: hypothetical protein JRN44_00750 [Nitrososphaerota archaeon]|jgi:hypothetical protein|nr:hypothetical protein [Nitrososphaerota archaeon]MDG6941792.1 hypothetical protein [Nitrososphaerota archaeon]MDG6947035.1 hypothetical protein [Nitrososphaerota archaeon]MDG6950553.1 hypothetical protein [Nitrososphaerota archaeon]
MRERRSLEKGRLPSSTYELWLERQTPERRKEGHREPPVDLFEGWLEQQVKTIARRSAKRTLVDA